jgi:hypothetical protein
MVSAGLSPNNGLGLKPDLRILTAAPLSSLQLIL